MQARLADQLFGPATGAVHHHIGLVQGAIGRTDAGTRSATHDQIGDLRAAE